MKRNRPFTSLLALSGAAALFALAGCGGLENTLKDEDNPRDDFFVTTSDNRLLKIGKGEFNEIGMANITGLAVGETIAGLDSRPSNGQLYARGSSGQLYTINSDTGVATAVGAPLPLTGAFVGFDFNPSVDRIRIINNNEENVRQHPDTGALAGTDGVLTPAADYVACAYTPAAMGAATTLYVLDADSNRLFLQGGRDGVPSPNGGAMTPVGALGVDITNATSFDIDNVGKAFMLTSDGKFYRVNLDTGAADELTDFGFTPTAMTILPGG